MPAPSFISPERSPHATRRWVGQRASQEATSALARRIAPGTGPSAQKRRERRRDKGPPGHLGANPARRPLAVHITSTQYASTARKTPALNAHSNREPSLRPRELSLTYLWTAIACKPAEPTAKN